MKKITALLIALIMTISAVTVFAEGNAPSGGPGGNPPSGEMGTPPDGTPPDGMGGGGTPPDGQGGGFGGSTPPGGQSSSFEYTGAAEITSAADIAGEAYASETADESALIVNTTDAVSLTDVTVTKTGDSDGGDNCNFYGLNAALLVMGGSTATITGATITSSADGANGVFSYGGNGGRNGAAGDGTTVIISDSTIVTTGDGSGGIMTTGGGVTYAYDLDVETAGRSSAPIRTDRGGGKVYVKGGSYVSNGLGSPVIYSTAEVRAEDASLISNLSEGVCIEGKNAVELTNCELTANNSARNGNARFLDSVMLYQSMSGDADSGTSGFTMDGGSLTSKSGHVFHVTNTNAVITLRGVRIVNEDPAQVLLSVCDDGWSGAGNRATLRAAAQTLEGTILVGDNAELTLELTEGSVFTGSIDGRIVNAAGETVSSEAGTVSVTLDESAVWTLTADSYVTEFHGSPANVKANGFTLYVNGVPLDGTN